MSLYEFLRTVAAQLGDDRPGSPFRRYALKDLIAYYNEALCFVATHRPDLFTDYVVMKLDTGSFQDAKCCGCQSNLSVVAQIDADGNTIKDLTDASSSGTDKAKWYRAPCRTTANGATTPLITSITIESGVNGVFTVTPPVPAGVDMWVKLKCARSAPQTTGAEVAAGASLAACTWLPALRSYVLYRALQGDRHAVGATTEARQELRAVYDYLGLKYKQEMLIEETSQ